MGWEKKDSPLANLRLSIELNVDIFLAVCWDVRDGVKKLRESAWAKHTSMVSSNPAAIMFGRADLRVCQGRWRAEAKKLVRAFFPARYEATHFPLCPPTVENSTKKEREEQRKKTPSVCVCVCVTRWRKDIQTTDGRRHIRKVKMSVSCRLLLTSSNSWRR